jgi:lipopolysaccharide export LptBFGC system permease protein LptF
MHTNKINSYISYEVLKTFFIILFSLSIIAWTARAVNFLDLIVENGFSIKTYLIYSLLNLSNIITKFIPLSFLIALFLTVIKLQRNNEFIILWTIGMKKIMIANLFFLISIYILLIQLIFSVFINPYSLNVSRFLLADSKTSSFQSLMKENEFSDSFEDLTFFIRNKDEKNIMENIFIHDRSDVLDALTSSETSKNENVTIYATKGFFKDQKLILFDGTIQTLTKNKEIENINFSKTEILLEKLNTRVIKQPKIQETSTLTLLKCMVKNNTVFIKMMNCDSKKNNSVAVENFSRRIGMPLYIPIVSIILSFLLISYSDKKKFNKYYIFLSAFIVLMLAEILVRYSSFSQLNTLMYFLLPIFTYPIIYLILNRKFNDEKKNNRKR